MKETIEPSFADVHVTDLSQVDAQLPRSVRLGRIPRAPFRFRTRRVSRGSLRVEETRCSDGVHMRLPDGHGYLIGFPVCGVMRVDHLGRELDIGPGRAAVVAPSTEVTMASEDHFDVVLVDVGGAALEDMLEALLGRAVPRPLRLTPFLSLGSGAGRTLGAAVRLVAGARPGLSPVLDNPISAEPLRDEVLIKLLRSTEHPHRDALDAVEHTWGPRTVRRCLDYIEAHCEQPLTLAALAAEAGLSIRALEGCWLRHRDGPPGQDVGRARLGRADADLRFYRPGETTIAAIATSWGFPPRSFAAVYGMCFGCLPEQTLRGPAYA